MDEDQFSTEIDLESVGELDNEDIFNAIFLKKRSFFSSSRHTSVLASHRSENIEQKSDLAISLLGQDRRGTMKSQRLGDRQVMNRQPSNDLESHGTIATREVIR